MKTKQTSKSISIIIPTYMEEKSIKDVIQEILEVFSNHAFDFEIIVIIDEGPNDRTLDIVKSMAKDHKEIQFFSRKTKQGVASAIAMGIDKVKNDVTMIVMGDLSEDANDLMKMAKTMNEGYDMAFASRFTKESVFRDYPAKKLIANRLCNFAIRILFGINAKDITNAVKAYKSERLKKINITSKGFEIFIELPIKSYLLGAKNFTEVSTNHFAGDPQLSKFSLTKEGPRYFKIFINCLFRRNL